MKKRQLISEIERNNILGMHYFAKEPKKTILEQTEDANFNKAVQSFLNTKGVKDDAGKELAVDGSIGNYPASKSAQAIYRYQQMIGVTPDGVWGKNTYDGMPEKDKELFKSKVSENGDLYDKFLHWVGLD